MAVKDLDVGLDFVSVSNINNAISVAVEAGYKRCYVPVSHPRYRREFTDKGIISSYGDDFSRSIVAVDNFCKGAVCLRSQDFVSQVVGKLSDHINVDSSNETFRKYSETILEQEIKWCAHLGMQSVMLKLPLSGSCVNLARIVYSRIKQTYNTPAFLVRVPMVSPSRAKAEFLGQDVSEDDSWSRWNNFRTYCGTERKVKLALEVADDLPDEGELERWLGEPMGCAILRTKSFLTNESGFPVLSKAHQKVVDQLLKRKIPFLVSGCAPEALKHHFPWYLKHLASRMESKNISQDYYQGYEDFLQIPLQPLMDNLDQYTYEIFEGDPVKYVEYRNAIKLALLDKKENAANEALVVMVVGAGRGPLVDQALQASEETNVKIKLYAIEKNPHAIVSLQTKKIDRWKDRVTIVATDMRSWKAIEKADIMVSELLGSFGDNELSPECLDGAQNFLKKDGISIPSSYSSYICPTQTHKIFAEITDFVDREKPPYQRFEQPYVVHLQTVYQIAALQKLFTFDHPNRSEIIDNNRFKKLTFEANEDAVIHGFSGFFDTVLYKDVVLSIVPETFSHGMFSWFPIFFPFREPVQVKKSEKIEIVVWRLRNEKIVWYEWALCSPIPGPVHNPNGRSYFIGLT